MPSPFPGMNPYLEQDDAWHSFHGGPEEGQPTFSHRSSVTVYRPRIKALG